MRFSAGTLPAFASISSIIPRIPCRHEASCSIPPETRRVTSGIVWLEGIHPGQLYGFRFAGPYAPHEGHRFNPDKLVVDPYATAIASVPGCDFLPALGYDSSSPQKDLSFSEADDAATAPKCVVTHADFDWQGDQPLRHSWESTVIYELHVRGYTVHPSAGVSFPGTYRGLIEKIPYLKDLGVTAVELMPVQEFNENHILRRQSTDRRAA